MKGITLSEKAYFISWTKVLIWQQKAYKPPTVWITNWRHHRGNFSRIGSKNDIIV